MALHRTQGYAGALMLAELGFASIAFWLWVGLWDTMSVQVFDLARCTLLNEFLLLGLVLGARSGGRPGTEHSRAEDARAARRQTIGGLFAVFVVAALTPSGEMPRAFLISFAPVLYVVLRTERHYLPRWVGLALFRRGQVEPVLVVGSPEEAQRVMPWLRSKESLGLRAIGLLCNPRSRKNGNGSGPGPSAAALEAASSAWNRSDTGWKPRLPAARADFSAPHRGVTLLEAPETVTPEPNGTAEVAGLPCLGTTEDLDRTLESRPVRQVLVLGLSWPEGYLRECIASCERYGVRLHVVSDLDEHFRHSVTLVEDNGIQLIGLREEPLESPINRLLKRLLDILVALPIVLLVLPPAIMLAWLLQRLQSPGPVFFQQQRSGLWGRRFPMIKFRTMSVVNDDETRQVRRDDPRVFPAGNWMRRFSLDELPQFLNVLQGDMSVVGPRPHIPAHDEVFAQAMQNYRVRSAVKPGITGLAQVRGFRGGTQTEEDITRRVASDIEYLERWTLELDLWIIFRTFWQVVFPPRTAY